MTAPQPYGPQYGPPPSGIVITTKYSFLAWLYAVVKPKVYLNGYEFPVMGWGRAFFADGVGPVPRARVHAVLAPEPGRSR